MSAVDNPAAFPVVLPDEIGGFSFAHSGMTLRDWFAGQALAGGLASGARIDGSSAKQRDELAETVYAIADAMLAARGDA